ncbi:RNB domain-containing ribonuclease [Acidovorax sp. sic0104]|uniref:RNB domain-containing ribonuclease n=1 Tax=Acidovorax sp. sic0104 TaxID=2854784 RepID=UPI001C46DE18|nr:RNB domain-containing ribonuclease [Acidovorax sp. sic0104]
MTIDSESTRDIDDAFTVHQVPGGDIEVLVAIADPTGAVPVGSETDDEALALAASIYARDRVVKRMLPLEVSEGGSSLVAGQARPAMVMRLLLGPGAAAQEFSVEFCCVTVTHRLAYGEIPGLIKGGAGPLQGSLQIASALASSLFNARASRGALALFDARKLVMTDEEGRLIRVASADAMVGHLIIQELMILANSQLAQYMARENIPGVYRNHEPQLAAPPSQVLAESLRAWMESGAADMEALNSRVGLSVGRARYAPTLAGHYGLALPAYAHSTSPLRRYPDLINVRQVKAFVQGSAYAHSQAQLVELCERINTTLSDRKDGTSAYHKEVLRRETEDRLDRASLKGAPDQVLVKAVKLAREQEQMPEVLRDELIERMRADTITDKVVDGLVTDLPPALWPRDLATCFVEWVVAAPGRVMHVYNHGAQTGALLTADIQSTPQAGGFEGVCRISRDGTPFTGRGRGTRKRDAEQGAVLDALAKMLGCETPAARWSEPDPTGAQDGRPVLANPKGALLEFCQARSWAFPDFQHTVAGPSHSPYFTVTVRVATPLGARTGSATATSKKQAEANASAEVLPGLQEEFVVQQAAPAASAGSNPVGELQERAQQRKWAVPEYDIRSKQAQPPIFEAIVKVFEDGQRVEFSGFASSKNEAKRNAAAKALASLR